MATGGAGDPESGLRGHSPPPGSAGILCILPLLGCVVPSLCLCCALRDLTPSPLLWPSPADGQGSISLALKSPRPPCEARGGLPSGESPSEYMPSCHLPRPHVGPTLPSSAAGPPARPAGVRRRARPGQATRHGPLAAVDRAGLGHPRLLPHPPHPSQEQLRAESRARPRHPPASLSEP